MLIVGDNEVENGEVSVRRRGEDGDLGAMSVEAYINLAVEEIETKKI